MMDANLLIQSEIVEWDDPVPPFSVTGLEHDKIKVQTMPWEWSFEMRRAAALATLDLLIEALRNNLILKDGTALNVAYHNGAMVWFDVLSLEPLRSRDLWRGYPQFCRTQLFPLLIEAHTGVDPRPWLLLQFDGIGLDETSKLLKGLSFFKAGVFKHVFLQSVFEEKTVEAGTAKIENRRKRQCWACQPLLCQRMPEAFADWFRISHIAMGTLFGATTKRHVPMIMKMSRRRSRLFQPG